MSLVLHQLRFDQKVFWRNPAAVFFTVLFPVLAAADLRRRLRRRQDRRRGRDRGDHLLRPGDHHPGGDLGDDADAGDDGRDRARGRAPEARPGHPDAGLGLHRRQNRQLDRPLAADVRDRASGSGASSTESAIPWSHLPELLVVLAVGAASFCCLGIALTAAIPSQDAAAPIVNALLLPLYFLSGVFIPDGELPDGVIHFADYFPIRHFFQAFFDVYVDRTGIPWHNLAVVAAWGVAGLLLAIRYFRWTPRGG